MIRIRKLFPIVLIFLLFSCAKSTPVHPLENDGCIYGNFEALGSVIPLKVSKSGTVVTVTPDTPSGYSITFDGTTAEINYGTLTHSIASPTVSRLFPLYEMALGKNTEISGDTLIHSDGAIFRVIK